MDYGKRRNNMNAPHKFSFTSVIVFIKSATFCLVLAIFAFDSSHATPCFDNPQRAYDYLIAKESSAITAREQAVININRASEGELVSLNGIGSSKAQAIILYREMFGGFTTIDELSKVKGIGAKTIEKNRTRLSVQD